MSGRERMQDGWERALQAGEAPCDWRRALRWLRLQSLRFAGGSVDLGAEAAGNGESVRIGTDVVAVTVRDLGYWIPFAALRDVTGTCAARANSDVAASLRAVVAGWVDTELDPGDPDQMLWHSFITRSGRGYAGAVRRVSDAGIHLATRERSELFIPWDELGAAIERLE